MKFDSKRGRNMDPKTLLMNKIYPKTIHGIFFWHIVLEKIFQRDQILASPNPCCSRCVRATIWSLFERLLPFCFLERNSVELYICFLGPYRLRTLLLDVSRLSSFHSVRLRVAALCFQFCFIFGLHVGKQVFVEHVGV